MQTLSLENLFSHKNIKVDMAINKIREYLLFPYFVNVRLYVSHYFYSAYYAPSYSVYYVPSYGDRDDYLVEAYGHDLDNILHKN